MSDTPERQREPKIDTDPTKLIEDILGVPCPQPVWEWLNEHGFIKRMMHTVGNGTPITKLGD